MFSISSPVPAALLLPFSCLVRAALAFAIGGLASSVAFAVDFPVEGFWMASQLKHIRLLDGEWRAVVHVYKHKPVGDLTGLAYDEEANPWRVSFFLIETENGEQKAEFYQITYKARITDTAIHLVSDYASGDEGRLDYTKTDKGLYIQQSSTWPETLREKDLPYPPFSIRAVPDEDRGGMLFEATTHTEATEIAYRTIDRFFPPLVPGPIPEGDRDFSRVKEILRRIDLVIGKSDGEVYAAKLMHLGPKAEMVLAQILNDVDERELRRDAAQALMAMDRLKAGPIVLRNLPDLDSVVINQILGAFLYDLEHGRDLSFKAELYESSVKLLESWLMTASAPAPERRWRGGGLSNSGTEVLRVVGTLGSAKDIPLLRRLQAAAPSIYGTSSEWIQMMLTMTMARLGDPTSLGKIRENLSRELPSPLTTARSRELCNWLQVAGFTQNEEFVPTVCRFLETRPPTSDEPDPSVKAAQALDQIIHKKGWSAEPSGTDWINWWKVHQAKYVK